METTTTTLTKKLEESDFLLKTIQPPVTKMSTNAGLTMLMGDEWITASVLIAYEVGGRVVPAAIWLFVLERIMTFAMLFHAADPEVFDFFTTHSFNTTVFSPKLLLQNPLLFNIFPAVFATSAPHCNILPTPPRLQQPLPSRIKIAAALFFTPFFALAHFQLFFHFQRILQSTYKQLEDSTDLPQILILLCIIFYCHAKVNKLWKDSCNAHRFVCDLRSKAWDLMGHFFLVSPVLYTAFLMRSVDGGIRYAVVTLVGVVTGVGVSLMHSKWKSPMNRTFLFPFEEFVSLMFLLVTAFFIREVTEEEVTRSEEVLQSWEVIFCVLMALPVVYTAKAVVFLLRIKKY